MIAVTLLDLLWSYVVRVSVACTLLALAMRRIPEARFVALEDAYPRFGHAARAVRKLAFDVEPFVREVVLFLRGAPMIESTRPSQRVTRPPTETGGALLVLVGVCLAGVVAKGCAPSHVQVQATAASEIATAWNRVARPALVAAFEADQRAAVDRVCPAGPCPRGPVAAAAEGVRTRWAGVWAAAEAARAAHDLWRTELEACRRAPDAGCADNAQILGLAFAGAVVRWRCDVRELGHPELDTLPGAATCPAGGADAGQ